MLLTMLLAMQQAWPSGHQQAINRPTGQKWTSYPYMSLYILIFMRERYGERPSQEKMDLIEPVMIDHGPLVARGAGCS